MRPDRRMTVLGLAALAAVTLTACGGGSDKAAGSGGVKKVRVTVGQVTEPYVIPWLVGQKQGLFKKQGVDVTEVVASSGGTSTLRSLVAGDLAMGEVSFPAVVDAKIAGTPVTAVGGAARSVYGLDFYASAKNSKVNKITDAKKWAFTTPGSITEAMTFMIPQAAKIDGGSIQRIAAGGIGQGVALLESGGADVAIVPPSLVAKDPKRFKLVVSSEDYLPALQQGVMTVQTSYLKDNPAVIKGLLTGYQESVGWIKQNPDQAAQIYADNIGIDKTQGRVVVDGAVKADNWSAGVDPTALDTAVKAMRASGFKGEVPWCNLFDLSQVPTGAPRALPVKCGS